MPNIDQFKIIAMDMDGTVLNSEGELDIETVKSINKLISLKKEVFFATGRMPEAARKHLERSNMSGFIISNNGALIIDILDGKVILDKRLNKELVDYAIELHEKKI
ncbi:HAD family hydrolase [Companilactobacillus metriopterae]|uniref:HAD family hydrolase n=1 Tax=Companilactobacillus metriopterae TaxID=1909267 RepID=UPI00100BF50A|nr:HAD hydrolase family protein [Companilactobacillus metriopterae]